MAEQTDTNISKPAAEPNDTPVSQLADGLSDTSVPRFAAGCRWGGTTEAPVVLFPEGTIRVEGTGRIILELCDGHFTLGEIVQKLEQQFMLAPKGKVRADVQTFLEQLRAKRIIDY